VAVYLICLLDYEIDRRKGMAGLVVVLGGRKRKGKFGLVFFLGGMVEFRHYPPVLHRKSLKSK
jgi:hypothetical protein